MKHEDFLLGGGLGDFSGTLGPEILSMNDTPMSPLKKSPDKLP